MRLADASIPDTHSIFTAHTCRAVRGSGFYGKVIARRPGSRQGMVIACETYKTRGIALRAARKAIASYEMES
jgi:hypothetical protein